MPVSRHNNPLFETSSHYHRYVLPFLDITFCEETVRLTFAALLSFPPLPPPLQHHALPFLPWLVSFFGVFSFSAEASSSAAGGSQRYSSPLNNSYTMVVLHVHWFDVPSAKASCFFPMNVNQVTVWHYNSSSVTKSRRLRGGERGTSGAVGGRLHVHSTVKYKTPEKAANHLNHSRSP